MSKQVCITGIGIVSPLGIGKEAFWDSLIQAKSAIAGFKPAGLKGVSCCTAARVSEIPYNNRLPRSVALGLKAAELAISDAAIKPGSIMARNGGIYIGETLLAYDLWEAFLKEGKNKIINDIFFKTAAAHISAKYSFNGECLTLGSGCIGGLAAIGRAMRDIRMGACSIILAGGTDSLLSPYAYGVLSKAKLLSTCKDPNRAGRPFDIDRDMEVTAEGSTFFIIEDQAFARKRGIPLLCSVAGFAMTDDGFEFKRNKPDGEALALAGIKAIKRAGLDPEQIDLVVAHASGFKTSDAIEVKALATIFKKQPLPVVISIKGATGQPFSAGGPTQAAVAAMAITKGLIPPTVHYRESDPSDPFDHNPEAKKKDIRGVLITSYGYGGGKAALVLRKPE